MRCDLGFVTEVSLFRSAIKVDALVALQTATSRIAAPEYGNMSSLIKLAKAKKQAVPAVSLRVVFSYENRARSFDSIRLFAYSREAYKLLCEAVTEATEHSHYEPRLEIERVNSLLRSNNDLYAIIHNDFSYYDLLEEQNVFLAINAQTDLSHPSFRKFKPIFFHLSHAITKEDYAIIDCFPVSGNEVNRIMYYENPDHFGMASNVPGALENYQYLMERPFTDTPVVFGDKLPNYSDNSEELFKALTYAGFSRRYPNPTAEQIERLEYEIAMIIKMGFPSYFLVVWDFIDWSKSNGIAVGPGRGSAAGSIVAYCLGITQLCPIEHGLFFERFLNPARVSMPDIDIDFSQSRRQEVIRYIESRYSLERVSQIITFGKLKSKSAFKDAARLTGITAEEANAITKLWPPSKFGVPPDLSEVIKFDKIREWATKHPDTWEKANYLEGFIRQEGVHPAGVIISPTKITDFAPVSIKENVRACQFDKDDSEKYGLLKMDLLGLKNLDILQMACKLAGIDFYGLYELPLDDFKVYERFAEADTHGVFQFESRGMQDLLRRIEPTNFNDIAAATALYRPGPLTSGLTNDYVKNKHALSESTPLLAEFKTLLADTYEVFVYQEQIMKIVQEIGGFTLSKADTVRKAIGKKDQKLMDSLEEEFISGSVARGHKAETIRTLWSQIKKFGDYCFNKSHSAAYSLISYYCMWFKVYHPKEYVLALLTADMGDSKAMAGHFFHFQKNVTFEYPRINEAQRSYSISPTGVMIGLGSIKEVNASEEFAGKFDSITDFLVKCNLDKTKLTQLIYAGFFDPMEADREMLLGNVPEMLAFSKNAKTAKKMFLFDIESSSEFSFNSVKRTRISPTSQELHAFGFNIKEGFIVRHSKVIDTFEEGTIAITLHAIKRMKTKAKQEDMAILSGYSTLGEMDIMVFPREYRAFGNSLTEDKTYLMRVRHSPATEKFGESWVIERCMSAIDFKPAYLILRNERGYRKDEISKLPVLQTGSIPVFYEGYVGDEYESHQVGFIDILNDEYLDSLPSYLTPKTTVFVDEQRGS